MTPITAHFRGGPLDGTTRAIQDAPPTLYFPTQPNIDWADDTPVVQVVPGKLTYRRARGIVAGEVIYDYQPTP